MYSIATNTFALLIYIMTMLVEYILFNLFGMDYTTAWLITTLLYVVFIIYQIIARINEDFEKNKIKELIREVINTIDGIPFINKNEKMVIQWDRIFKKLVDNKETALYDKIAKIKPEHIERYINKYPTILLNSDVDVVEGKHGNNKMNSFIAGKGGKKEAALPELVQDENLKKKLFIREMNDCRAEFSNYDGSIIMDALLMDEYEPDDVELSQMQGIRFDGFSVVIIYKDRKYTVVPKVMVYNKKIDKEKWFYRNVEKLLQLASSIVSDEPAAGMYLDEIILKDYLSDDSDKAEDNSLPFYFYGLEENKIIFVGLHKGKVTSKAFCELITNHNGFELNLIRYESVKEDKKEILELQKTVVIGSSYQPVITLLEKMPIVSRNIGLLAANKELTDIVIR